MDATYVSQRPVQPTPGNQYTFPSGPHPGQISMPEPSETKQNTSRRTVLIGLLGVTGLAATGGVIGWLLFSSEQSQNQNQGQNQHRGSTSPTFGNILSIYRSHLYSVGTVAWSPNSKRIASGSHDVQVWNPSNGEHILSYRQHHGDVQSLAWSPDGNYIASGSNDQTMKSWDANSGNTQYIFQGHTSAVWVVAWSPDGTRIASGSDDQTVQIWDATSGKLIYTYRGHRNVVNAVA
jgi:WD40 repeat protein